ncbi:MAG: DUF190 domain-containing protein [Pseudomonadota bacterium]
METFKKKRIEIVIEALVLKRLIAVFEDNQINGYTVYSAQAGSGKSGAWQADGVISGTNELRVVFCIVDETRVDQILDPVFKLISRHIGIVTVSDVDVIRGDQFD